MSTDDFKKLFRDYSNEIHRNAKIHGFYDKERNDGELIALMHSELSEALEALRGADTVSDKIPPFSTLEEELADVVIRIMDYAAYRDLNVAEAISAKIRYNKTRSQMHGKKF